MMRGTFANTRIKNQMVPGVEGGVTAYLPGGEIMPIYDAAMKYQAAAAAGGDCGQGDGPAHRETGPQRGPCCWA